MRKKHLIIAASIISLLCAIGIGSYFYLKRIPEKLTKDQTNMVFRVVNDFANCAGYYDALSWLSEKADLPEASKSLEDRYRGWYMAGAFALFTTGAVEDWKGAQTYTESLSHNSSQSFKARLEVDMEATQKDMDKFFKETCEPLGSYQESLVDEMRKLMTKAPQKDK